MLGTEQASSIDKMDDYVLRRPDQAILESLLTQPSKSFGLAGHLRLKGCPSLLRHLCYVIIGTWNYSSLLQILIAKWGTSTYWFGRIQILAVHPVLYPQGKSGFPNLVWDVFKTTRLNSWADSELSFCGGQVGGRASLDWPGAGDSKPKETLPFWLPTSAVLEVQGTQQS